MKFHALPLALCSLSATALALKFPITRTPNPSLAQTSTGSDLILPRASNRILAASNPTDSDLSTVNDMIYIANITLGGNDYRVQLDTGSSDLWIKGQTSPLPNSNQTSMTYNLTYGIGWASGHISYIPAEFAGISIAKQAYLDSSSAQNPALTYGTSGILGLGFTSLSTIDALVNKTGDSSGRSVLYNLFNDNPSEPNFIAFSLQRSSDPSDEVKGTFLIGEVDPDYAAVNNSSPIPTFPQTAPNRWTILLDAVLMGSSVISVNSSVPNAPSNRAVVLLDSGTSYTYAPSAVCKAIYGNIPGALLDTRLGMWTLPCNVEIDIALQINGQVFPIHPLDMSPASLTTAGTCVGSFVPQDTSSVGAGNFDWIIGDNVLRSVYSVYDFGDFDSSGHLGNPHVKLLSLIDPNEASADFASARGSQARNNITYAAANSSAAAPDSQTVTLSNDVVDTIHKVSVYFPAMLAIMALNAVVILVLAGVGIMYMCRKRGGMTRSRRVKGRSTPLPLEPLSSNSYIEREPAQHTYQPVSMALTEDTFVPPSPAFAYEGGKMRAGKGDVMGDRPNSVA
ncbi:acid protease [Dentipellis sp. KUC8613]|nr:acid protease [Dentipellis sp. KUC8613]